jgi:hypothetical protein
MQESEAVAATTESVRATVCSTAVSVTCSVVCDAMVVAVLQQPIAVAVHQQLQLAVAN